MRAETEQTISEIEESLALLRRHLDPEAAKARLAELNARAEDPTLWDKPERAQKLMRERQQLDEAIAGFERLERDLADAVGMIELAEAEGEDALVAEAEATLKRLRQEAKKEEVATLLSGEADPNDAFLEVHSGAGGTESQDWAQMLLRMYIRWAEDKGYKVDLLEESEGEGAGIKSATIQVAGAHAYGWLKTESGVHRLVRISPFDANQRRHTSFASVWVYPVVDDNIEVEVNESDCRIDTFRASGAGGQHVNRTESAIRITHIPTGIVVACQTDRSQHRNRATAWSMLRARLYELELQKREEAAAAQASSKTAIGWGHQIRSYVLQPYQLVKDLRTGVQTSDPDAVLGGDIDAFIEAALAHRVKGGEAVAVDDVD
ncbi:MAG: peptide chain release factor 2 [Hyphomicrobiaceae bacterium]